MFEEEDQERLLYLIASMKHSQRKVLAELIGNPEQRTWRLRCTRCNAYYPWTYGDDFKCNKKHGASMCVDEPVVRE